MWCEESGELGQRLRDDFGLPLGTLFVNRFAAAPPPGGLERLGEGEVGRFLSERAALIERQRGRVRALTERLKMPSCTFPELIGLSGSALTERLRAQLEGAS